LAACLVLGTACRGRAGGATPPPDGSTAAADDSANACSPQKIGLSAAKIVSLWKIPESCHASSAPGPSPPIALHSEVEFKRAFTCTADVPSGVDFTVDDLLVLSRMLSPAGVGESIADDGKTTTIISLSRSPCPSDYPPMPVSHTVAYLMPANSVRVYAEAQCTFPPDCK
jgi:hypothetical protein